MAGLKTIVLSYNNGAVTEASYGSLSPAAQSQYQNFLERTLKGSQYANSIWKLSYEMYIPSGVILWIAEGVTLLADGGLFSGPGTLAGDMTKIDAGFQQIFTTEVNFKRGQGIVYPWNVTLSHPEWFGAESIIYKEAISEDEDQTDKDAPYHFGYPKEDASVKIQKAIDLILASTARFYSESANPVVNDTLFIGGEVVCKPSSLYRVNKTISLPLGVSFDGGNSNFIYNCTQGSYMFKVNMDDVNDTWKVGSRGQMDVIKNIRMINPKKISNAFGFYSGSQCCTFENIQSFNLCQTFRRFTGYIDSLTLRDINIAAGMKSSDDRYQIDISYIGDNLLIDNAAFSFEDGSGAVKGISVNGCGGGLIQRITNGTIEIKNSKAMVLSAVHQESGNTIIENSQIEINGLCHFKQPGVPAVVVNTRNGSYEIRPISIKNSSILYNRKDHAFSDNELDIQLGYITGPLKIENVVRMLQMPWTEASSAYGVNINNKAFLKNPAANSMSSTLVGSIIGGAEEGFGYLHNNFVSYQIDNYGTVLSRAVTVSNADLGKLIFPVGTYAYWASIILDKERNLGFSIEAHKQTVSVTGTGSCVNVDLGRSYYLGMTIRLFRKQTGSTKLCYIDLPVCTSNNSFYDLGTTNMFGEKWTEITDTPAERAKVTPSECYDYRLMGNNVSVRMPSRPNTSGAGWRKGDTIVLNSGEIINV